MTQQLPPGWATQFDQQSQRWFFIDTSTGHTQWEQPSFANLGNYNSTSITQPMRMAPQNFTNPFESPAGVPSQYYAQSAGPMNTFASNSTSHADQHPQYVEGKKTKEHLVEPEKKEGKSKSSMGKLMVGAMIGLPITSLIRSQKSKPTGRLLSIHNR